MKHSLVALTIVGIWIAALCTAPHYLGRYLWDTFGYKTDLPLKQLAIVATNSLAVLAFILLTKRVALFRVRRPQKPAVLLLFLPLVLLNVARGPLVEFELAIYAIALLSNFLTAFWEEFLFRGLVQDRLSVMGQRWSIFFTALLFSLIHSYEGLIGIFITFSIGLALTLARDHVGIWPLVLIHFLIDFINDVFLRRWESFQTLAMVVIWTYFVIGLIVLARVKSRERYATQHGGESGKLRRRRFG